MGEETVCAYCYGTGFISAGKNPCRWCKNGKWPDIKCRECGHNVMQHVHDGCLSQNPERELCPCLNSHADVLREATD